MNKNLIPYILPIITLFGLLVFAFLNPNITGFTVSNEVHNDVINATISIYTSQGLILPWNATVIVYLDDKNASMGVERFIKQSGGQYDYKQGRLPEINYIGPGYTGNHNYFLELSDFGLGEISPKSVHILKIVVTYNDIVISESSSKVKKI
mgnify:CR=1 FL=1